MHRNFSLNHNNTFGLDVMAAWAVKIPDLKDLEKIRKERVFMGEKHLVLGGGSNCLFLDDYFEGLAILIENKGISITNETDESVVVSVAAGEDWAGFVEKMVNSGYGGLENLSLIPGKVGAAPMQNIGAYGVELKNVFNRLQAFDLETGDLVEFDKEACDFGYRSSIFKTTLRNRFVILSVEFLLIKQPELNLGYGALIQELERMRVDKPGIKEVSQAVINIRKSKLPDPAELGNAGSFFKNPVVHNLVFNDLKSEFPDIVGYPDHEGTTKLAAGWLIEMAGWKGYRSGDAGVHHKQALVLVNYGKATGRDIYGLAMQIQHSVREKFGVHIEPEVNLI